MITSRVLLRGTRRSGLTNSVMFDKFTFTCGNKDDDKDIDKDTHNDKDKKMEGGVDQLCHVWHVPLCLFVCFKWKISNSKDGDHLTCKVAAMTSCRKAGTANALLRKLKFYSRLQFYDIGNIANFYESSSTASHQLSLTSLMKKPSW